MAVDTSIHLGRAKESAHLVGCLERAVAGDGNAVAIVGEAGIGKSTLVRQLAEAAAARGAVVARGQCHDTVFAQPFAPWCGAVESYAATVGADKLARALGHHAPALVRLVPDLVATLADPHAAQPLPGHEERVRLGASIARLISLATTPLLLVLEDLQWADEAALDLLDYAAAALAGSKVVLAVTYRDTDEPRLLAAEGALRRTADLTYIRLTGLATSETEALAHKLAGRVVPADMVRAVADETGGNPFYIRELILHLVEEGGLREKGVPPAPAGVPRGVRAVVGRRVARLSPGAAELLAIASAFFSPFTLDTLRGASGFAEDRLLNAIEEAQRAGLIRSRGDGRYDLSHGLVRRAILDGINPDRRTRLHRRLAEGLATGGAEAAEVASQFHASRQLSGGEKGLPYALKAAAQAHDAGAYENAVILTQLAVDLAATATADERAEALSGLALAHAEAVHVAAAIEAALAASEALIGSGKAGAAAELLERVARSLADAGAAAESWRGLVERGLQLDCGPLAQARLKLLNERYETISAGPIYVGHWLGFDPSAVALARGSGDEQCFAATVSAFDWRSRDETEALIVRARTFRQPNAILKTLDVAARDLLHRQADYRAARGVLDEMLWTAERFGSVAGEAEAHYGLAKCRAILGDLAKARESAAKVPELVARLGPVHRLQTMSKTALFMEIGYLGGVDWRPIAEASESFVRSPESRTTALGTVNAAFAALAWAECGEPSRAETLLDALAPLLERMAGRAYMHAASIDICAAALWHLQNRARAPRWAALALAIDPQAGTAPIGCVELSRARLASLAGQPRQATAAFAAARRVLDARGFLGARAIVDLDEARHQWSRDRAHARELAEAALARFATLAMAPWIDRARAFLGGRRADHLTQRELDVIGLLANGASNKEIARQLSMSVATVSRHVANIYPKIGARSRADATRYAVEQGILRRPA
jgi:DNA-binding CsgD family transcriptional regulator